VGAAPVPRNERAFRFRVWAPFAQRAEIRFLSPASGTVPLDREARGYFGALVEGVASGSRYRFVLDGRELPDPASRSQPEGVHGPSEVVAPPAFSWEDSGWSNHPLERYVVYELHVGTFTEEGTFEAAEARLEELAGLGITAVEPMPIGEFPGHRNWGYDGVFPYSVQSTYGGPEGFARFVDRCHQQEMAVVLDVVYNHLGPEGNVLADYGPYFTDRYRMPWGPAVNLDGRGSDEVRSYFVGNALMWFEDYHVDALRLDAIHGIVDVTARPFLLELAEATHELAERSGRPLYLIAESDLNEPRVVSPPDTGGLGLVAQWNDDFHHAVHALVTGERNGYYADFGSLADVAAAIQHGFALDGRSSTFRDRRHGASSDGVPAHRLVTFVQNHDQIGNRARGERLSSLIPFERQKLVTGLLLLSPAIPLLFMGQEYGETAPFPYFVSHSDRELVESVRKGRAGEFASFRWEDDAFDPADEETFRSAKLSPRLRAEGNHRRLWDLHRELLRLRRVHPVLSHLSKDPSHLVVAADEERGVLTVHRRKDQAEVIALFNFGDRAHRIALEGLQGRFWRLLDSSDDRFGGPGSDLPGAIASDERLVVPPDAFVLYEHQAPSPCRSG
jgi:maltooligosyltrehalose trehalohydrolase